MKRLLALLLALVLTFSLVACGNGGDNGETGEKPVVKYLILGGGNEVEKIEGKINERLDELEAGYTIKEIHADLPELANNISYSSVLRNLNKMGMSEKKVNLHKIEKLESQDMIPTSNEKMKMTNAERNTEKLKTKKPVFSYDPHTKGKDFI